MSRALGAVAFLALLVVAGAYFARGALRAHREEAVVRSPPPANPVWRPSRAADAPVFGRSRLLVDRLTALLSPGRIEDADEEEIRGIEAELLELGEAAVPALLARLDAETTLGGRERLFNILRRLPGRAVEARLIGEARGGAHESMRTMAIESLAGRVTDRALETLAAIARTDPKLPARPLIAAPRDSNDPSTELPDEEVFTPRMQAMAALASTKDPRAVQVLIEILRSGPDDSLRMEAARNLEGWRGDPGAVLALREAALIDPSPYVRLAALHALNGAKDASLAPFLEGIIERDPDAGVRALARLVLAGLPGS